MSSPQRFFSYFITISYSHLLFSFLTIPIFHLATHPIFSVLWLILFLEWFIPLIPTAEGFFSTTGILNRFPIQLIVISITLIFEWLKICVCLCHTYANLTPICCYILTKTSLSRKMLFFKRYGTFLTQNSQRKFEVLLIAVQMRLKTRWNSPTIRPNLWVFTLWIDSIS